MNICMYVRVCDENIFKFNLIYENNDDNFNI